MQKIIIVSLTTLALITGFSATAETAPPKPMSSQVEKKVEKKPVEATVNLYESPSTSAKIIKKLPLDSDLVAIYHQDDWMKVGDRKNGETGWVDVKQYHQAKRDFYHDYFHNVMNTVYLSTTKDKEGKIIIEGYRNGKKLSDADAKKQYDQMQEQAQHQWQSIEHLNQAMDQQMQIDYWNARRAMDDAFQMMPGIVIIQQPTANNEKNNKEKTIEKK